jgi:hypothetical protein
MEKNQTQSDTWYVIIGKVKHKKWDKRFLFVIIGTTNSYHYYYYCYYWYAFNLDINY